MPVETICISPTRGGELELLDQAEVIGGAGIEGDRFCRPGNPDASEHVTLVEAEEVERFNAEHGIDLPLIATRRNIVTRGVRLNDLVDREFMIGEARFLGIELCEPCVSLGRYLADSGGLSRQGVVSKLSGKAGLRAAALTSGRIAVGDDVRIDS